MHSHLLRRTRGLVLAIGGKLVSIGLGGVVAEMLGGTTRFMLTIGGNRAPA